MDKEIVVHALINIAKKVLKWSLIVLAVTCTVLIVLAVYLLVSEYFYDGDILGLGQLTFF